jgi:hypothetical protein
LSALGAGALSRWRISLPVLKTGTTFSVMETDSPVRGLRPVRASRFFTENAPKPRSSTRVAPGEGIGDGIEDRIHDLLDIALVKMRVLLSDLEHQFGFDHG